VPEKLILIIFRYNINERLWTKFSATEEGLSWPLGSYGCTLTGLEDRAILHGMFFFFVKVRVHSKFF
jgi:hypothetical protein